jgi:plasmid replication initiation protein
MKRLPEIRQSNALINARFEYTELQLDLFFFLLSKLRKSEENITYELNVKELSALTGKKYNAAYLQKATADMGSRMFEVPLEDRYRQLWMFQYVDYLFGQGIIEVRLAEAIIPYLFDLKNNFTSYELAAGLRLTSKYAKRIYQLCSQWKDQGETKKYDILDFKRMLCVIDSKGNDKAERISDLKTKVLNIAVKQINEHTDLRVSYTLEKHVRTFKSITFKVMPQTLAETIPFALVPVTPAATGQAPHQVASAGRLLAQLGIATPALVAQILGSAAHVAACNKFAHELKTGKHAAARSPAGLLLTILGLG